MLRTASAAESPSCMRSLAWCRRCKCPSVIRSSAMGANPSPIAASTAWSAAAASPRVADSRPASADWPAASPALARAISKSIRPPAPARSANFSISPRTTARSPAIDFSEPCHRLGVRARAQFRQDRPDHVLQGTPFLLIARNGSCFRRSLNQCPQLALAQTRRLKKSAMHRLGRGEPRAPVPPPRPLLPAHEQLAVRRSAIARTFPRQCAPSRRDPAPRPETGHSTSPPQFVSVRAHAR